MGDGYNHPVDEKKVKFRQNILGAKEQNIRWIIRITLVSFFLSAIILLISTRILKDVNNLIAVFTVLFIIFIGIVFDMIGIAVTAADEPPFHALASRKVYGAKQAIKLIRNANKVSSFCNDVIGDICGVISGTAGAMIVFRIVGNESSLKATIAGLVISGLIASFTVGGKAIGKTFAIEKSNYIVYKVSVLLQFVNGKLKPGRSKSNEKKLKER